jgi:xylan 1,4-beta-xylosidase
MVIDWQRCADTPKPERLQSLRVEANCCAQARGQNWMMSEHKRRRYNPIIHTKANSEKWWSKRHGTLFEDVTGSWWMISHGYENGHYNMGRQTLLQPVEWTKAGWYRPPDNIEADQPMKRPAGSHSVSGFTLSDSFSDSSVHPQWQFFGEYDTTRFHFADSNLVIRAKGNSVGESSPLLCIPSNHSYIAQVEIVIQGEATGGLALFYSNGAHSGILADRENIFCRSSGLAIHH